MDENSKCELLYLPPEFWKAFDTFNHRIILNIIADVLNALEGLTTRKQFVSLDKNVKSSLSL